MVLIWLFKDSKSFSPLEQASLPYERTIDVIHPMISEVAVNLFGSICPLTLFGVSLCRAFGPLVNPGSFTIWRNARCSERGKPSPVESHSRTHQFYLIEINWISTHTKLNKYKKSACHCE